MPTKPKAKQQIADSHDLIRVHGARENNLKDVDVELPAGLIGDPSATPRCPVSKFVHELQKPGCPEDTQVGTTSIFTNGSKITVPVYNLVPPPGELPAHACWSISSTSRSPAMPALGSPIGPSRRCATPSITFSPPLQAEAG